LGTLEVKGKIPGEPTQNQGELNRRKKQGGKGEVRSRTQFLLDNLESCRGFPIFEMGRGGEPRSGGTSQKDQASHL